MRSIVKDQFALFFLTLWILWTCFSIFNFFLFFKYRNSIYIRNRDPMLILCSALGQYAMMTSLTWKIVLLPENFPNMVDLWFLWLFIPLHFLPYPVRSLRFIIQHAYKKYQLKKLKSNGTVLKDPFLEFLQKHPFLRQNKAYFILNWILMAVAIIWGIYRNIKYPINHPGKYGGENTKTYYISCTVLLILASIFLWLAVYFQQKTGEELYVTPELITIGILWLIFISLYIIFAWSKIGSFRFAPIFHLEIVLCISSFLISFGMPVQLAVVLTKYHREDYKPKSSEETKNENNLETIKTDSILDNDENQFKEKPKYVPLQNEEKKNYIDENIYTRYNKVENIMEDEEASELLLSFSQKRMCEETILFIKDINIYKNCQGEELTNKFHQMVESYITDDSPFHLNILGSKLKAIENETDPNTDTFEPIMSEVWRLIKTEIFPNFRKSPDLKKFIEKKSQEINKNRNI